MRLRLPHAPYIANKISIDILNSKFVDITSNIDDIKRVATAIIEKDIKKEMALEERVREILEDNEDEIEFMKIDQKQLFFMAKKRLAQEFSFIIEREERYNDVAHQILDVLLNEDIIDFRVSENRVKNLIYKAIDGYLKGFEDIEELVLKRIDNYKRKLVPGTEEYELVFQKLYEDELNKRGLY